MGCRSRLPSGSRRRLVVVAFVSPSTGYVTRIRQVYRVRDTLVVEVLASEPAHCRVGDMMAVPRDYAIIPRHESPIIWRRITWQSC